MLKNMFLVLPEQLESMKGGVNKNTNNIALSDIEKKQKDDVRPHVHIRAAGMG
jgi:hypothetical protein